MKLIFLIFLFDFMSFPFAMLIVFPKKVNESGSFRYAKIDSNEQKNYGLLNSSFGNFILLTLLVVLTIFCVMKLRREPKKTTVKYQLGASRLLFENGYIDRWNPDLGVHEAMAELLPHKDKWEFPRDQLKLGKQLGSGAFGVVYKAEAIGIVDQHVTTDVAVKMIKPNSDASHTICLISELKVMMHIGKHLNIVNLLGSCTGDITTTDLMVIVEYCRFGNILEYLIKQRECFVDQVTLDGLLDFNIKSTHGDKFYENEVNKYENNSSQTELLNSGSIETTQPFKYHGDYNHANIQPLCTHDLICWSFQIARGMAYLSSKKILHGDLAIRNILLAEDNIVKICDFGFARNMYNDDIYKKSTSVPFPVKWMAIESLRDRVFSTQSDVWSYGVVLWELFSLAVTPYPDIELGSDLFSRLTAGYRMKQPTYANSQIYNIMLDCWKMNPLTRPSFDDLAERTGYLLTDDSNLHYITLNEVFVRINEYQNVSPIPNDIYDVTSTN